MKAVFGIVFFVLFIVEIMSMCCRSVGLRSENRLDLHMKSVIERVMSSVLS